MAELRRFFIGGSLELEDLSYVRIPGTFKVIFVSGETSCWKLPFPSPLQKVGPGLWLLNCALPCITQPLPPCGLRWKLWLHFEPGTDIYTAILGDLWKKYTLRCPRSPSE